MNHTFTIDRHGNVLVKFDDLNQTIREYCQISYKATNPTQTWSNEWVNGTALPSCGNITIPNTITGKVSGSDVTLQLSDPLDAKITFGGVGSAKITHTSSICGTDLTVEILKNSTLKWSMKVNGPDGKEITSTHWADAAGSNSVCKYSFGGTLTIGFVAFIVFIGYLMF